MSSAAHLAFERDIVEIEDQISRLREMAAKRGLDVADELRVLTAKLDVLRDETYRNLTPMEQVQVARHPRRPYTLDYIEGIFTDWFELKGGPVLPQRRGHRRRLGAARRQVRHGDRAPEGPRHEGEPAAQLRDAASGGGIARRSG